MSEKQFYGVTGEDLNPANTISDHCETCTPNDEYPAIFAVQGKTPDGEVEIRFRVKADSALTYSDFVGRWAPLMVEGCKPSEGVAEVA